MVRALACVFVWSSISESGDRLFEHDTLPEGGPALHKTESVKFRDWSSRLARGSTHHRPFSFDFVRNILPIIIVSEGILPKCPPSLCRYQEAGRPRRSTRCQWQAMMDQQLVVIDASRRHRISLLQGPATRSYISRHKNVAEW